MLERQFVRSPVVEAAGFPTKFQDEYGAYGALRSLTDVGPREDTGAARTTSR
jgi:hypothetical protein